MCVWHFWSVFSFPKNLTLITRQGKRECWKKKIVICRFNFHTTVSSFATRQNATKLGSYRKFHWGKCWKEKSTNPCDCCEVRAWPESKIREWIFRESERKGEENLARKAGKFSPGNFTTIQCLFNARHSCTKKKISLSARWYREVQILQNKKGSDVI